MTATLSILFADATEKADGQLSLHAEYPVKFFAFFSCRDVTGQRFLETDAESITKMTC